MNHVIKMRSLVTSLLLLGMPYAYADDSQITTTSEATIAPESRQYILPPPSPYFTSNVTFPVPASHSTEISSKEVGSIDTKIIALENSLEKHQSTAATLLEELHATARNSDLESEQYDKTVSKLQNQITALTDKNKTLLSQLSSNDSQVSSQTRLLNSLKQESSEFKALQSTYKERNNEVLALRGAYTAKSDEAELLKKKIQEKQIEIDQLNTTITGLNKKLITHDQTQAELIDMQIEVADLNDSNSLLKVKILDLENNNKSLASQVTKMTQEQGQVTQKLSLYDESNKQMEALKSAFKEKDDEALSLKTEVQELSDTNKTLLSQIGQLELKASESTRKLSLFSQTEKEFIALQSSYKDRNDETVALKTNLSQVSDQNKTLLSKIEQLEQEASNTIRKLNASQKTNATMEALQSSYKERNNEAALLKEKLAILESSNKTLLGKIETLNKAASENIRKLNLFEQTTAKYNALESAYKERSNEANSLKNRIIALDKEKTTLISSIEAVKANLTEKSEKLGLLSQSNTELSNAKTELETTQNQLLKLTDNIKSLESNNNNLKDQLSQALNDKSANVKKLASLSKESEKLTELENNLKDRNAENVELKKRMFELNKIKEALENKVSEINQAHESTQEKLSLAESMKTQLEESESLRKTLTGKMSALELEVAQKARKLTNMVTLSKEFEALQSAYRSLKEEKVNLFSELNTAIADDDNDGIINKLDKCPSTGANMQVDKSGCIIISDADGDKVLDENDLCPDTKANERVNSFGCTPTENITLKGVNFTTGSDQLTASSLPIINATAKTLLNNPEIKIEVAGYTDSLGNNAVNQRLSQRRADSVTLQLINQGIDSGRILSKGYGEKDPIASNSTRAGRLLNRRVELKIR